MIDLQRCTVLFVRSMAQWEGGKGNTSDEIDGDDPNATIDGDDPNATTNGRVSNRLLKDLNRRVHSSLKIYVGGAVTGSTGSHIDQ